MGNLSDEDRLDLLEERVERLFLFLAVQNAILFAVVAFAVARIVRGG